MANETTLRDLAKLAGVSINTISRALNHRDGVNEQTKARILALAEQHHYRPNMMARSMRGMQSTMIGTLVGDITDNFFIQLLSGVEEEVGREAMPIIIGNTGESVAKQTASLELLLSYGCKNIVITPVNSDTAFIDTLRREKINFVIADRVIEGAIDCDQVSINNRRDASRAVEYLIQCGHRKIAIINQRSEITTETDRTLGFQDALSAHGIPQNDAYIVHCEGKEAAAKACHALLCQPDRPTALFIAKDVLALGAVSAVYDLGLTVPGDLSVFIYGMPEWSQAIRPYFTCMERAVKDIGRTSARVLISRIKGNDTAVPVNIRFDSNLIIRDSVRFI